jgi:hypothetical protein
MHRIARRRRASGWHFPESKTRRLAIEPLEERALLAGPQVASTTPDLGDGVLEPSHQPWLVRFDAAVVGAAVPGNIELRAPGDDSLLGTLDDSLLPVDVVYAAQTATLRVPTLAEGLYRLTVHDAITDTAGQPLDGNADGVAGGDWSRDVVVVPGSSAFIGIETLSCEGVIPESCASADFNGDGNPDLVAAYDWNVALFTGDGEGHFQLSGQFPCPQYAMPASPILAVGDFDRNGKPDLAMSGGSITVLINTGSGFVAPVTYPVGAESGGLVTADFNGDQLLDLAVTGRDTGTVAILAGDGNGHFGAPTAYDAGGITPFGLAAADFDADGDIDVAVTHVQDTTISVLRNDGAGHLGAAASMISGDSPASIVAADLTGDGRLDLCVGNINSSTLSLFAGTGDGTFAEAVALDFADTWNAEEMIVSDFNLDLKPDLAIACSGSAQVVVALGDGAGGFTVADYAHPGGVMCAGLTAGDWNRDGKPDLAVTNRNTNNVGVLLGFGDGQFAAPPMIATGSLGCSFVPVADFNRDGRWDLAVQDLEHDQLQVYLCDASGAYQPGATLSAAVVFALAAGDFNGDGNPDLAGTLFNDNRVALFLGDGQGGFGEPLLYDSGCVGPKWMTAEDLNHDQRLDMVIVGDDNTVGVLLGSDQGGFTTLPTVDCGGLTSVPINPTLADFNGDGWLDLAVPNSTSNSVTILRGSATGALALALTIDGLTAPSAVAAADLNGDGHPDLAVANQFDNSVSLLLNDAAGGFAAPTVFAAGGAEPCGLTGADFNGDGLLDLAVVNAQSNSLVLMLGDGQGGLTPGTPVYGSMAQPENVIAADLNRDGRPDLLVPGFGNRSIMVLTNVFGPSPVALTGSAGRTFVVQPSNAGGGQLLDAAGTLDAALRLRVGETDYAPALHDWSSADAGQTVVTPQQTIDGLEVSREVTVPAVGGVDFARSVDVFHNPTGATITRTVQITSNLGADGRLTLWNTSDGDAQIETTDAWLGVDDVDGAGLDAVAFCFRGSAGLKPTTIAMVGDNVQWTYQLTIPAGGTARLAYLTVVASTRAGAQSAAESLAGVSLIGQAAAFLASEEIDSFVNFNGPTAEAGGPYTVGAGSNVTLDASASLDPNQAADTLVYTWDLDGDGVLGETGSAASRGNEIGRWPSFSAVALGGATSVTVSLRVEDAAGNADTDTATISVRSSVSLDADGNGTADALTDGILILRYLFAPTGAWSYSDAVGVGASRTEREAIRTFLNDGKTTVLDVDGNGTADALTDGILILRYLFAPTGTWSYSDAVGTGAMRNTREQLRGFLNQFNPAVTPNASQSASVSEGWVAEEEAVAIVPVDSPIAPIATSDALVASAAGPASVVEPAPEVGTKTLTVWPASPTDAASDSDQANASCPSDQPAIVSPQPVDPRALGLVFAQWQRSKSESEDLSTLAAREPAETDAGTRDDLLSEPRLDWLRIGPG